MKDSNGNLIAPRWLAVVVPLFAGAASWGASYGAMNARVSALEARAQDMATKEQVQMVRDLLSDLRTQFISYAADGRDGMVRIARIEAALEEMRRPR